MERLNQRLKNKRLLPVGIPINLSGLNQNKRRREWSQGVKGLMTVLRFLPEDLYDRVMLSDENIKPGEIFEAIVKRSDQRRARSS